MGASERLADDRAHLGFDAIDLIPADGAEVAASDRGRGDDVGLARRLEPDLARIERHGLAATDKADIVGDLVFWKLAAELVDDPRKLIDRAIIAGADARGMSAVAGDRHGPAPRASASGRAHIEPVLHRQVLEIERGVGALAL